MRKEIKFRVWSEDQKTYDYKFPYNSIGDFYVNTRGKVFSNFGYIVTPEVIQDAFIIEQYTGLKDKNGKEIYEGDILYITMQGLTPYLYIVRWYSPTAQYLLHMINDESLVLDFDNVCTEDEAEIKGNIHESPELLEKESGRNK